MNAVTRLSRNQEPEKKPNQRVGEGSTNSAPIAGFAAHPNPAYRHLNHSTSRSQRQAAIIQMQRTHGNAFVQRYLAQRSGRSEPIHGVQRACQCGGACGCGSEEESVQLQAVAPTKSSAFANQPAALQKVIQASFAASTELCKGHQSAAACFDALDSGTRLVLMALFNRLNKFGLWSHVSLVQKVWSAGAGGGDFATRDNKAFLSALLASGRFCVDTGVGGMLHRGKTSLREKSTSDSLHLSVGANNTFDAHIDAISPVLGSISGIRCQYDPTRAAGHIGKEVVPSFVPGLEVFPEQRGIPMPPGKEAAPPPMIGWGIRF